MSTIQLTTVAPTHLGQHIRQLRDNRKMTQGELARDICFRSYISQIEQGTRFPTARILSQLADRLETELDELVPFYVYAPEAAPTQCLALANVLAERSKLAAATAVLQHTIGRLEQEMRPDAYEADVLETEGLIQFFSGHRPEARDTFAQALAMRQRVPSRRYLLGRTAVRYGLAALATSDLGEACGMLSDAFYQVVHLNPAVVPESTEAVIALHEQAATALAAVLLQAHTPWLAMAVFRMLQARWHEYGIDAPLSPQLQLCQALAAYATGLQREAQDVLNNLLLLPGHPDTVARSHHNAGIWARLRGDWPEASRHQLHAWRLWEQAAVGEPWLAANELARVALHAGDVATADHWLAQAPTPATTKATCVQYVVRQLLCTRAELMHNNHEAARLALFDAEHSTPSCLTATMSTLFSRLAAMLTAALDADRSDDAAVILDELELLVMPQPYAALPNPPMP